MRQQSEIFLHHLQTVFRSISLFVLLTLSSQKHREGKRETSFHQSQPPNQGQDGTITKTKTNFKAMTKPDAQKVFYGDQNFHLLNWYLKTFHGYLFGFCLVSYLWMSLLIIFVWFTLKVKPWINYFLFHEDNIWNQCRLYLELYEMIQMIPLRSYMVGW